MTRLTKEFIETEIVKPESGQRFYRDKDVPGFAVRVTPNSKSFILEKRVGGSTRRLTIGKCSEMPLELARKQACIMLGEIAKGNDPRTGRRINTLSDITLREVLQKFLETKPIEKPLSKTMFRRNQKIEMELCRFRESGFSRTLASGENLV